MYWRVQLIVYLTAVLPRAPPSVGSGQYQGLFIYVVVLVVPPLHMVLTKHTTMAI